MSKYQLELGKLTVPERAVEGLEQRLTAPKKKVPRRALTLAACLVVLCCLSMAAVAKEGNTWRVDTVSGKENGVNAVPQLHGRESEQSLSAFIQNYGDRGEMETLEGLEAATGLDILWSDLITQETLDGTRRVPSAVGYSVSGGDEVYEDYLITGHQAGLFFQPLAEGTLPTWWDELLLKNGQTEVLGDLIPVQMVFSTKNGVDASDPRFGVYNNASDFACKQVYIKGLDMVVEIISDYNSEQIHAFFTMDEVAYWIKVSPNDEDVEGEAVLLTLLESLK